jgi:predicted aspartyl protease
VLMGTFFVAHHPAKELFDTGASHTFLNKDFAIHHNISIQEARWGVAVQSPEGRLFTKEMVLQVPIELAGHGYPTNMIVLKGQDIDAILGMNWLVQHEATIGARK